MSAFLRVFLLLLLCAAALPAQRATSPRTLTIYVIDVEGGNATLFVAPSGESVLIDTGNPGARDAGRIMEAVKDAGLSRIDNLLITHWHGDHYGGTTDLAKQVAIGAYYDHGPTVEPQPASTEFLSVAYPALVARARRTIVKPGDKLRIPGLDWTIVTSAGTAIAKPLRQPGAGRANPHCANFVQKAVDRTENAQSVASHIAFGRFRVLHPGDLTWNEEAELMCPRNPLGTVDLLIVGHHSQPSSNSPPIVHGVAPRVSIINNGTAKGGQPESMRTIFDSPGLEDVWQMHFSVLGGQEHTVPGLFIANGVDAQPESMPIAPWTAPQPGAPAPRAAHEGKAYWFKVVAREDGSFTVTNSRNGFSRAYRGR